MFFAPNFSIYYFFKHALFSVYLSFSKLNHYTISLFQNKSQTEKEMLKKAARLVFLVTVQDNQFIVNVYHFIIMNIVMNYLYIYIHAKIALVLTAFSKDILCLIHQYG